MSNGQEGGRDGTFRLPRPTFGLFFPIFFGPIGFGGGPRRRPPGGGLSALPQPVTQPPPFSPPPTFPGGPAANDPIFRQTKGLRIPRILGRLPGLAGIIFTAAEILVAVIEGRRIDRVSDIEAGRRSEIARIQIGNIEDRLARELELRIQKQIEALRSAPETFEIPELEPPPAPLRRTAPEIFPDVLPAISPPLPGPLARPGDLPGPVAPTVPAPRAPPTRAPLPVPTPRTFPLGLPVQLPVSFPRFTPVGDPSLLTPPQATPLPFTAPGPTSQFSFSPDPRLNPQLQPQTDPEQRCKRRCDDRTNRTQCFKGLFRETTNAVDFTEWQEIDCITGRDIESSGVAGRITSEVVELF